MPPQPHWSKSTSASPADAYSLYGKPLHKREESSDLEPTLLAIPLVIILVIGLISLLIIGRKKKEKPQNNTSDSEGLSSNGRDEVALQESKARVEIAATNQTPTPVLDDTPKIPVEHNNYRPPPPPPPQSHAPEVDTTAVAGASTSQPTKGLAYHPSLPEVEEAVVVEDGGEEQRQLHVPEVDGVPVDNLQQALEMNAAQSSPIEVPAQAHHPAMSEADGGAAVEELPGPEEQMDHELDGAKRV
ncbi:hypothetical protein DFP73DRAFT_557679 [Morchella snyderi]|nr:hypothetical protein DFP73DRAFT_557679 [Morchella snyderi]